MIGCSNRRSRCMLRDGDCWTHNDHGDAHLLMVIVEVRAVTLHRPIDVDRTELLEKGWEWEATRVATVHQCEL